MNLFFGILLIFVGGVMVGSAINGRPCKPQIQYVAQEPIEDYKSILFFSFDPLTGRMLYGRDGSHLRGYSVTLQSKVGDLWKNEFELKHEDYRLAIQKRMNL